MKLSKISSVMLAAHLTLLTAAYAGPYSDELSKCLLDSTSKKQRATFVRWMFVAGAAHPAVQDIANVSPELLDQANRDMADLSMTLLVELCREESEEALRYEGAVAFQFAFKTLGEVAGMELFSSPEVQTALAGYEAYLDAEKLQQLASQPE